MKYEIVVRADGADGASYSVRVVVAEDATQEAALEAVTSAMRACAQSVRAMEATGIPDATKALEAVAASLPGRPW